MHVSRFHGFFLGVGDLATLEIETIYFPSPTVDDFHDFYNLDLCRFYTLFAF